MPTTIERDAPLATLINVFTVRPQRQRELVDLLTQATEDVMVALPAFVSANIHASTDGTKVVNYAQWPDEDAFTAMLANPVAQPHLPPGRMRSSASAGCRRRVSGFRARLRR